MEASQLRMETQVSCSHLCTGQDIALAADVGGVECPVKSVLSGKIRRPRKSPVRWGSPGLSDDIPVAVCRQGLALAIYLAPSPYLAAVFLCQVSCHRGGLGWSALFNRLRMWGSPPQGGNRTQTGGRRRRQTVWVLHKHIAREELGRGTFWFYEIYLCVNHLQGVALVGM